METSSSTSLRRSASAWRIAATTIGKPPTRTARSATTELINSVAPFQGASVPIAIGVLYFGAWVLGAAISTIAVIAAVLRSHIREPLLHFARIPALMTTLAMAIMLVSTLIWGLSLRVATPALFQSNEGVMGTHTSICWLMIVVVMAISTSVAGIALKRCFAADAATHIPT